MYRTRIDFRVPSDACTENDISQTSRQDAQKSVPPCKKSVLSVVVSYRSSMVFTLRITRVIIRERVNRR